MIVWLIFSLCFPPTTSDARSLFDGNDLKQWDFVEDAWYVDSDGAMTCRMKKVRQKNGEFRTKSMGYAWTNDDYGDFELSLEYKLSQAANSGVFFRTDKSNPVQGGFEIQLMDDAGYQAAKGPKDPKNLNGALYDCQGAVSHEQKPVGQWNSLAITCVGNQLTVKINGKVANKADLSAWSTARKNPDGSVNKFKTALADLPKRGKIGFQNHGQQVWFRKVTIKKLD